MDQEKLKSILKYNQDTGEFIWVAPYGRKMKPGMPAGVINGLGYCVICIGYKKYLAHRLAFLYMTGSIPEFVDHIDMDRSNNSWNNLRAATKSENMCNRSIQKNNTSGYKNISKTTLGFHVWIGKNGKVAYSKCFKTLEEAIKNRDEQLPIHHGSFTCV